MPELPTVSVVIPALGAEATIGAAIDSVLAQNYAGPIEVVVADGDRDGASGKKARSAMAGAIVVPNPSTRTADALNAAIKVARGDVIVRLDAHAVLPPDYVRVAIEELRWTGAAVVGGLQIATGTTPTERAIALAMNRVWGAGGAAHRSGTRAGPSDTVYLGVFDAQALEETGGFDPRFIRHQDFELNHRIRSRGGLVWFTPQLRVTYRPRSNLRALGRQFFGYGAWKSIFVRDKGVRLGLRQLAPPLLVGYAGIAALVAPFWPNVLMPLGVYLAGLTMLAAIEAARFRDPALVTAGIAAMTMHLAWGTGFLVGLLPRRNRAR